MKYLHKTPFWLRWLYSDLIWRKAGEEKIIYLTFDDGPIPEATPAVLGILKEKDIKATFFCVGDNIRKFPEILELVIQDGHTIGNHTFNHLDGWACPVEEYLNNIEECQSYIESAGQNSTLFRPPYGKIKRAAIRKLKENYNIIMWDVLSADFDADLSEGECLRKTIKSSRPGSIVVFHDNIKAIAKVKAVLPLYIDHFQNLGYTFRAL